MVQRIQSLYLLLAAGFFGSEFLLDFAKSDQNDAGVFKDGVFNLYDHPALLILSTGGLLLSLIAIFMYNRRDVQIRMSYLISTLSILLPLVALLLFMNPDVNASEGTISDSFGLYSPVGALVLSILAAHNIRKDERLVKSMDRLR